MYLERLEIINLSVFQFLFDTLFFNPLRPAFSSPPPLVRGGFFLISPPDKGVGSLIAKQDFLNKIITSSLLQQISPQPLCSKSIPTPSFIKEGTSFSKIPLDKGGCPEKVGTGGFVNVRVGGWICIIVVMFRFV